MLLWKLFKTLFVLSALVVVFKNTEFALQKYQSITQRESKTPVMERYERSAFLKRAVPKATFERVSHSLPQAAGFATDLDPQASQLAYVRWFFICLMGWLYFSYFSPFTKNLYYYGFTKTQLFFFPFAFMFLFSLFSLAIRNIFAKWTPALGGIADSVLNFFGGSVLLVIVAISVLAIPVSLLVAFYRVCRGVIRAVRTRVIALPFFRKARVSLTASVTSKEVMPAAADPSSVPRPWWRPFDPAIDGKAHPNISKVYGNVELPLPKVEK